MAFSKNTLSLVILSGLIGAAVGYFLSGNEQANDTLVNSSERKPLYWVAPMDDNYRRDKPGKSPMGMDLVPVYEEDHMTMDSSVGTVRIAPHVVNNLGVRTSDVVFKSMDSRIETVGYVRYDEDRLIHIHPRVDGWIEELFVKAVGDPVTKGQPLYSIYSPQLVNAQEELLIALRRDNRSLINAARARLEALQMTDDFIAQLEKTRQVRQTITFYSPQEGVVDGLKIREGFYVSPGNTLFSIGKLDQVWVEAEVFERDSSQVKEGLDVTMTLDYLPGREWTGKVDYVYPVLNSETRTLRVRLKFDNQDLQLKPNMFAQVVIHAGDSGQVLLVPKEAVIRTGTQDRVVVVMGEGSYKSVEVRIGRVNADYVEILNGLNRDDIVVTSSQFLIDSESSKSSDFRRMQPESAMEDTDEVFATAVNGKVNDIDVTNRILNISRDAIPQWQRGPATMYFVVEKNVDISKLRNGQEIRFTFEVRDDLYITEISPIRQETATQSENNK